MKAYTILFYCCLNFLTSYIVLYCIILYIYIYIYKETCATVSGSCDLNTSSKGFLVLQYKAALIIRSSKFQFSLNFYISTGNENNVSYIRKKKKKGGKLVKASK